MRVVILGSGTSVPCGTRRPPAYLVQCGSTSLLVDAGAGSSTALAAWGVSLGQLRGVALTHLHPDHTVELVPMLFALHNPAGPRRHEDMLIYGPAGTCSHLCQLSQVYGRWLEPRQGGISTRDLYSGEPIVVGSLTLVPFAVQHSGACFAYRIEGAGRTLCLSGDTAPCRGIVDAARGVDLFICDCGALEGDGSVAHLNATEVGRVAGAAQCAAVVLSHLDPHVVDSDPVPRVRANYHRHVRLASDGLVLQL